MTYGQFTDIDMDYNMDDIDMNIQIGLSRWLHSRYDVIQIQRYITLMTLDYITLIKTYWKLN